MNFRRIMPESTKNGNTENNGTWLPGSQRLKQFDIHKAFNDSKSFRWSYNYFRILSKRWLLWTFGFVRTVTHFIDGRKRWTYFLYNMIERDKKNHDFINDIKMVELLPLQFYYISFQLSCNSLLKTQSICGDFS